VIVSVLPLSDVSYRRSGLQAGPPVGYPVGKSKEDEQQAQNM
jgi:hypothetical protein